MEIKHIAQREGRLSSFLKGEMGLSTGLMNRLKWQQRLYVQGVPRHTDYTVKPGEEICVCVDDEMPQYPAEDGYLSVLYEDEHMLAVDKPAGMLIHPSSARNTGTLANLVLGYYKRTGQPCAFHPITRLDRDTFGVVLLAKNSHIHAKLNDCREDTVKIYHALTCGGPEQNEGIIDAPIARMPLPSLLRCVSPEGKPSLTRFRVLERGERVCRLELQAVTGRTHQLRLHCAHMGFPIVGDPQYGNEESERLCPELKTQLLQAKRIIFPHPATGEMLCIESQMELLLP